MENPQMWKTIIKNWEKKHFWGQFFISYLHINRNLDFEVPVPTLLGGGTPKRADPPLARFWRLEKITDVAQQKGLIFFYYFSIRYTFRERGGFSLESMKMVFCEL